MNRAKLDEVITQTIGSITKPPIFGRSAPSKVKIVFRRDLTVEHKNHVEVSILSKDIKENSVPPDRP